MSLHSAKLISKLGLQIKLWSQSLVSAKDYVNQKK